MFWNSAQLTFLRFFTKIKKIWKKARSSLYRVSGWKA